MIALIFVAFSEKLNFINSELIWPLMVEKIEIAKFCHVFANLNEH